MKKKIAISKKKSLALQLVFCLLVVFAAPSLADERSADQYCPVSAGVLVLEDGTQVEIQCYGIREGVVWLTTSEGQLQSVPRSRVDLEATERANGNGGSTSIPAPADTKPESTGAHRTGAGRRSLRWPPHRRLSHYH